MKLFAAVGAGLSQVGLLAPAAFAKTKDNVDLDASYDG